MGLNDDFPVLLKHFGVSVGMAAAIAFRMEGIGLCKGLNFEGLEFRFKQLTQVTANGFPLGFCPGLYLGLPFRADPSPLLA